MLIQRNNITFNGFKVTTEAKPYLKNSLPRIIGYETNLTSNNVSKILVAFKKRMQKLAQPLEKKKGLDIILEKENDTPVFVFRTKQGEKIAESLPLSEFKPKAENKGIGVEMLTISGSKEEFNSVISKAFNWVEKYFPKTAQKPTEINETEIYKETKRFFIKQPIQKAPKTLTEAIEKVFT